MRPLKTNADFAVAVFLYDRIDHLDGLFGSLRLARPGRLYLVADGPKEGKAGDARNCREVRSHAEKAVDWQCEVKKIYAGINLGLRLRMESGLDELFQNEEFAVVLEDDCWPQPEFFQFCFELDGLYRSTGHVASVSGSCFLPRAVEFSGSYYFSRYSHCWGWATWADRWRAYRRTGWSWPPRGYRSFFPDAAKAECRYWNRIFRRLQQGRFQSWAYGWQAFVWNNRWVCACPAENLVTNVGFGRGGTHTTDEKAQAGVERMAKLRFPLTSLAEVRGNPGLDRWVFQNHFLRMSGRRGLWRKLADRWAGLWTRGGSHREDVEL